MADEPQGVQGTPPVERGGAMARFKSLMAEYGTIAIIVYFSIFFATLAGFAAAIAAGLDPESTGATLGLLGAAWLATKATQPLRIAATAMLTPVVAAVWHRTPWGRRHLQARREREAAAAREAEAAEAEATEAEARAEAPAPLNDPGARPGA